MDKAFLDRFKTLDRTGQERLLQAKGRELYRANHGRDPRGVAEERETAALVLAAAQSLADAGDPVAVLRRLGMGPDGVFRETVGQRRARREQERHRWS
jgi:hypothetical protein